MTKIERTPEYERLVDYLKDELNIGELKTFYTDFDTGFDTFANDHGVTEEQLREAVSEALHDLIGNYDPEARAVAAFFECEPDDVKLENYQHDGLKVYSYGRRKAAVGLEDEANKAAMTYIKQNLHVFKAEFLSNYTKHSLSNGLISVLNRIIREEPDSIVQELVENLVEDIEDFARGAIKEYGRADFLSTGGRGEENEQEIDTEMYYIYEI